MTRVEQINAFLAKDGRSLAGAESEFINDRYDNCANRCYYACFQAAVSALSREGIEPKGTSGRWDHGFVQAQFVGQLINRRKVYPVELRDVLSRTVILRRVADYTLQYVTQIEAFRALRRTRAFLEAIQAGRG